MCVQMSKCPVERFVTVHDCQITTMETHGNRKSAPMVFIATRYLNALRPGVPADELFDLGADVVGHVALAVRQKA